MNIYIIRHGEADNSSPDSSRRITEQGKMKLMASIQLWKKKIPAFDYIVHSPLRRAEETASIIEEFFEVKNPRFYDDILAPGSYSESLITLANSLDAENVAMVCHQPECAMHVANFTSNGFLNISYAPGTLTGIEFPNSARLSAGVLKIVVPG